MLILYTNHESSSRDPKSEACMSNRKKKNRGSEFSLSDCMAIAESLAGRESDSFISSDLVKQALGVCDDRPVKLVKAKTFDDAMAVLMCCEAGAEISNRAWDRCLELVSHPRHFQSLRRCLKKLSSPEGSPSFNRRRTVLIRKFADWYKKQMDKVQ